MIMRCTKDVIFHHSPFQRRCFMRLSHESAFDRNKEQHMGLGMEHISASLIVSGFRESGQKLCLVLKEAVCSLGSTTYVTLIDFEKEEALACLEIKNERTKTIFDLDNNNPPFSNLN